jgi:hypothetical protein
LSGRYFCAALLLRQVRLRKPLSLASLAVSGPCTDEVQEAKYELETVRYYQLYGCQESSSSCERAAQNGTKAATASKVNGLEAKSKSKGQGSAPMSVTEFMG